MKRTPIAQRTLPNYTPGEELANTLTHALGGILAVPALVLCILCAAGKGSAFGIVSSVIYGVSMVAMFTISSVYHGLKPNLGKKVMQIIDHCTIYFLIAGTYTVIVLSAMRPVYPGIGWGLFAFEWSMAAIATVFTAIDLENYSVFSMICYIGMGWAVLPFWRQVIAVMTVPGFLLLLFGGIAYSIGAILYGLGSRKRWMHSVFHVFVVLGAALQFAAVVGYAL